MTYLLPLRSTLRPESYLVPLKHLFSFSLPVSPPFTMALSQRSIRIARSGLPALQSAAPRIALSTTRPFAAPLPVTIRYARSERRGFKKDAAPTRTSTSTKAPPVTRGASKLYASADDAIADLKSGSTVLSAGFGVCGIARKAAPSLSAETSPSQFAPARPQKPSSKPSPAAARPRCTRSPPSPTTPAPATTGSRSSPRRGRSTASSSPTSARTSTSRRNTSPATLRSS